MMEMGNAGRAFLTVTRIVRVRNKPYNYNNNPYITDTCIDSVLSAQGSVMAQVGPSPDRMHNWAQSGVWLSTVL